MPSAVQQLTFNKYCDPTHPWMQWGICGDSRSQGRGGGAEAEEAEKWEMSGEFQCAAGGAAISVVRDGGT